MNFKDFYLKEEIITDNPNFNNWFGNSKVIDSNGNPLIVYHGSNANFDTFSYKYLGTQGRSEGVGFYFTDRKTAAEGYGKYLFSCYLKIEKPLRTNAKNFSRIQIQNIIKHVVGLEKSKLGISNRDGFLSNFGDIEYEGINKVISQTVNAHLDEKSASDFQGALIGAGVNPEIVNLAIYKVTGYDGIIAKGWGDYEDSDLTIYIPFFANQVKSIDSENFDVNNDSIKESEYVEDYPANIYGIDFNLNIYKDPNGSELYKIYNDNQGEGGCRIGIDSMNVVYCWIDNIEHNEIEKKFKLKFVNGKFSHPSMRDNSLYISSINNAEKFLINIKDKNYQKTMKKMFMIFQNIKYIKSDADHSILFTKG